MGLVGLKEAIAREERGQGAPLYMCGAIQHSVAFVVCRRCKLFFIQLTPLLQPSRSHCRHRAHQREDVRVCAALMAFSYFGFCLLVAVRDMTAIEIADTSALVE
jgi:hypothetical protein